MKFYILACLVLVACHASKQVVKSSEVQIHDTSDSKQRPIEASPQGSLMETLDIAKSVHKNVILNVGASWCLPCKLMEEEVFFDEEVNAVILSKYLYYKADAEKGSGPIIVQVYKVKSFPTLFLLDDTGVVLRSKAGGMSKKEFLEFIQ